MTYRTGEQDLIVACSTNISSPSALAVIRISGRSFLELLDPFFSCSLSELKPRNSKFTKVIFNSKVIDEVLLTYFPGPNSFTGEDCLEICGHGNPYIVKKILRIFTENIDCRLAKKGEFTYRALLNGKLSFSQVEGLDLLLSSQSAPAIEQGIDILSGELFESYQELLKSYLELRSSVELLIDFSDDIGEDSGQLLFLEKLKDFEGRVKSLAARAKQPYSDLLEPTISLFGPTNAGKSSLFNRLVGTERSIVTSQSGTTRDFISEYIEIDHQVHRLVDTAGVRETVDVIEKEGINRAFQIYKNSFFKILLVNLEEINEAIFEGEAKDFDLVLISHGDKIKSLGDFSSFIDRAFDNFNFKHLLVANILEDTIFGSIGPTSDEGNSGPIGPEFIFGNGSIGPMELGSDGSIGPMRNNGKPLFLLRDNLKIEIAKKFNGLRSNDPILIERQRSVILKLELEVRDAIQAIENTSDIGISSHIINGLSQFLEELVGLVYPDDVLDHTFSNFCIGK